MPPKAPSQAGKFKPVKRPTKPAAKPSATAAAKAPEQSKQSKSPGRGRGDGRSKSPGRGGRGNGRGRGGRESTDGRGRGRGGRFVAPTGAAFFTGASTKQPDDVPSAHQPQTVATIAAGQDGAVVLPFSKPYSATSSSGVSRTAAESVAAAARAKLGEGEEIIVAEIDMADADEPKKVSVLEQQTTRRDGMPSLFDDEYTSEIPSGVDDHYVYDSDSSQEERRRKKTKEIGIRPIQLPFPLGSHQLPMYACQEDVEEKKDGIEGVLSSVAATQLVDPEVTPPFLDWSSPYTRDDMKFAERDSWFLMKFPTRLPHMDDGSLVGGARKQTAQNPSDRAIVNSEFNEDGLEIVGSNTEVVGDVSNASTASGIGGVVGAGSSIGYDNTFKDIAPGRYGKIVVRKSGRTELVIGGQDGEPEVWKCTWIMTHQLH